MSSAFFSDPGVVTDLLAVCRAEGLFAPNVEKKVRVLLEHGLHPEQALLGTQLLSVEEYGEVLERVFGVPFVRVSEAASSGLVDSRALSHYRALVVAHEPKEAMVAFADPSHAEDVEGITKLLRARGVALKPAVTLWSDVRKKLPASFSRYSVGSLRRKLHGVWQRTGTQAFELSQAPGEVWHMHTEGREPVSCSPSSSGLPALALHFERMQGQGMKQWEIDSVSLSHGTVLSGRLKGEGLNEVHPLGWSQVVQEFLQSPQGILLCVGGDASARSFFAERGLSRSSDQAWRTRSSQPMVYEVKDTDEEEVFHAAMAGHPVLLFSSTQPAWCLDLRSLEVPVHILERHSVPAGMSWTAYTL